MNVQMLCRDAVENHDQRPPSLRVQIIRNRLDGLEHVEALLALRGDSLAPVQRKAKPPHFRRGKLRVAIYAALRDGPLPGPALVERIAAAHGLAYSAIYRSFYAQLSCLQRAGLVVRNDGAWGASDMLAERESPPSRS